ncbi:MAG: DUF4365 domain-containing protein [Halopseudomonas sp.]|uniref:DUF4365 domain-containing protein n=1 Tax=Halopseudomonas sp. TaxID=2901191 RepID=UPI003001634F
MDDNQKKELFSKAFVKALAAQSGLRSAKPDVDDDSIDVIIRGRGYRTGIRNPQIDVQLKCTANDEGDEDFLKFSLSLKNYNDLRGEDVLCPRYLFVLVVPPNCEDWLVHQSTYSTIKHCCYWFSLGSMPAVKNSTSITLSIPRSQRLTSQSMIYLMNVASTREVA